MYNYVYIYIYIYICIHRYIYIYREREIHTYIPVLKIGRASVVSLVLAFALVITSVR